MILNLKKVSKLFIIMIMTILQGKVSATIKNIMKAMKDVSLTPKELKPVISQIDRLLAG